MRAATVMRVQSSSVERGHPPSLAGSLRIPPAEHCELTERRHLEAARAKKMDPTNAAELPQREGEQRQWPFNLDPQTFTPQMYMDAVEDSRAAGATITNLQPLHCAAYFGRADMVEFMLARGYDKDELNNKGCTPLQVAAMEGSAAVVRSLLAAGADTVFRWRDVSALDWAAGSGHVDVARMIVEHGVDVNAAGTDGRIPLHYASFSGKAEEMVSLLLAAGAAVDAADDQGWTPLHNAAKGGHTAAARALLAAGADVSLRCNRDMSALDRAANNGHVNVATVLIEYGADVKGAGTDGSTALHYPTGDKSEMVSLLCLEGAAVDAVNDHGCTPLHNAAIGGHAASTRALLSAGADVSLRCDVGLSALDRAAAEGNADVVTAIVEHGADVNAAGAIGHIALHLAAMYNRTAAIEVLLEARADIEARMDEDRNTPLFLAAKKSSVSAVAMLLKHGASVNMRNATGRTPLHAAAASAGGLGTVEVVDHLLRWGADEKAADSDGQTPVDVIGADFQSSPADDVERVRQLLANAPADRAWRRRCFLVLCRAHYPSGRVQLGCGSSHAHDSGIVKRIRSRAGPSRAEVEWAGVASMLMGVGADPISLMGDGANIIFETIVSFL